MLFNIIKTIHILSFISWMAGLLYLPRIFVYHSKKNINQETSNNFKIMEKRLFNFICTPAAIVTWISGLSLSYHVGFESWLMLKIFMVILLTFFHISCGILLKAFQKESNSRSEKFFRIYNEVPTIILILIVILVVFKPL